MKVVNAALAAAGIALAACGSATAQDVDKGKSFFNQCSACHQFQNNAVGPKLHGIIGRKAGSVADFSYSPLMKAAGEAGLTWTEAALTDYLKNPTEYLKSYVKEKGKNANGQSIMLFNVSSETNRKDVTAYLAAQK